jgi:2-hydroxychromene-2-carboxylate isomerase
MKQVDWYFDFISPFAYLASESLGRLPDDIELRPRPILFAGLLQHWQTKGPAEIEPMRRYTFRHIRWLADRDGIPLRLPPAHPFNPLRLLRLCIAAGCEPALAQRLFRFVWAEGHASDNPDDWQALIAEMNLDDAEQTIGSPEVKLRLRENTQEAIARGVFGVPSFVIDDEIFWGYDALDFLLAYLDDPGLLRSPGMQSADRMPQGLQRRQP